MMATRQQGKQVRKCFAEHTDGPDKWCEDCSWRRECDYLWKKKKEQKKEREAE